MNVNQLPSIVKKGKKRVGRGIGSGRGGHTVGRGQKGQKARGKIHPLFEGTKIKKSLIKRLPFQRGKGLLKPRGKDAIVVNLKYLSLLPDGSIVNKELLIKQGIISKEASLLPVKILGDGELTKKLIVRLPISASAARKVQKAGGNIEQA